MHEQKLVAGASLLSVSLPPSDGEECGYTVGRFGVTSITVVEEKGPMCMLPWARVERQTEPPLLINLQMSESVVLAEESA